LTFDERVDLHRVAGPGFSSAEAGIFHGWGEGLVTCCLSLAKSCPPLKLFTHQAKVIKTKGWYLRVERGGLWEGYHESRRCSRDTYPE